MRPISANSILPSLNELENSLQNKMIDHLNQIIKEEPNQKISFARYMHETLYAPNLGYYSNPRISLGRSGDFTTAPELSTHFGASLANFIASSHQDINNGTTILEFGAGSGKLALSLLKRLQNLNALPKKYLILEVSAYLKAQQQQLLLEQLPDYYEHVEWINDFPSHPIEGYVIANEVLDAMPVNLFKMGDTQTANTILEGFVKNDSAQQGLYLTFETPTTPGLIEKVIQINSDLQEPLASDYISEVNLQIGSWLQEVSQKINNGGLIIIDYGFDRKTYYHPERQQGTLQCHFRHHHYSFPFAHPGIQDLTAHVDFTEVISCASQHGFELHHYGNMASTLLDMGILDMVNNPTPQESQSLNLLLAPHEMGELFKVMILTKNLSSSKLLPFSRDLCYQL